jgi:hypothetical protein
VSRPARWALSPLDCQVHVLADGDQTRGVLKARCGHQLPVVVAVGDHHRPPGRVCFRCELIVRANLDAPVTR